MSTNNSANHDNNLDALLEELQTSVSRPGSSLGMNGNTVVTGYREVKRTVTKESAGQPLANSTEYQIEYLNPANSTTVLAEGIGGTQRNVGLLAQGDLSGRNLNAYKTMSYEYRSSDSQDSGVVPVPVVSDARMRQNITELDSLLDDLHTAQKTGFADSNSTSVSTRHTTGIDSGLIEPLDSSTPRGGHVSRSVEKRSFQEQRYGSVGRASPSGEKEVRRELVFTGSQKRDQPSPTPVAHKEYYRYEAKTTSSRSGGNVRDLSPPQDRRQPSPSPVRGLTSSSPSPSRNNVRTYNYSSVEQDVPRTPTMHRSPSPTGGRNASSTAVRSYAYSNQDNYSPDRSRQPPVARSQSPSGMKVATINNYNYTNSQERNPPPPPLKVNSYSYSSRETRDTRTSQDVPRSPPPHRSPSPVSFQQPPLPGTKTTATVKTYNFDQPIRQHSPQAVQKFSPSDPSRTLTYQVSPPPHQPSQPTVITYKYSSHTSQQTNKYPGDEGVPLLPRPFPTPSPTPDQQEQRPPKKLDDLMASFSDTEIQRESHHHETSNRYMTAREPQPEPAIPTPASAETPQPAPLSGPAATAAAMQVKTKNIVGPPVYYPPGVELFAKKEESMSMQQSGGGMKAKAKAKYEYEESSKYKEKSSSGKAVVPVCLPVCCAMPCVIM